MKYLIPIIIINSLLFLDVKASEKITFNEYTGKDFVFSLVNSCSKDSLDKFIAWGKKNNILNYSTKAPVNVEINNESIKSSLIKISFNENKEFSVVHEGKEIKSNDLCSIFLTFSVDKSLPKTSLYSFFVNKAFANTLVSESKFFDELMVILGSTSIVQSLIEQKNNEDKRSFFGYRLARYFENKSNGLKVKKTFESILNGPFKIFCNKKYITIEDSNERITVYKNDQKYEINVFNFSTKQTVVDNKSSYFAEQSREFLVEFSKNCTTTKDSESAITAYKMEKETALRHMASYAGGHPAMVIKNMSRM